MFNWDGNAQVYRVLKNYFDLYVTDWHTLLNINLIHAEISCSIQSIVMPTKVTQPPLYIRLIENIVLYTINYDAHKTKLDAAKYQLIDNELFYTACSVVSEDVCCMNADYHVRLCLCLLIFSPMFVAHRPLPMPNKNKFTTRHTPTRRKTYPSANISRLSFSLTRQDNSHSLCA